MTDVQGMVCDRSFSYAQESQEQILDSIYH